MRHRLVVNNMPLKAFNTVNNHKIISQNRSYREYVYLELCPVTCSPAGILVMGFHGRRPGPLPRTGGSRHAVCD